MKKQELRIGNYLELPMRDEKVVIVDEVSKDGFIICDVTSNEWPIRDYRPIPLTEQWLKEFGFEIYKDDSSYTATLVDFKIWKGQFDKLHIWQYPFYHTDILYVHQLQNLYFALTGNELIKK